MLSMVEVYSVSGESLALPLQDLSGGYLIKDIDGLDPVKASMVSTKQARLPGNKFQASTRDNRNIVMQLGLIPEYAGSTVQDLRRNQYAFLSPEASVRLRFYVDGVAFVDIEGKVETNEAPMFTADPEATISIICFDPDFYALSSVVFNGLSTAGTTEEVLEYPGNSPAGFLLTLPITRNISGFTLYNNVPGLPQQEFDVVAPLLTGDVVTINTTPGSKSIIRTRSGVNTSLMYGVSPASVWPFLSKGDNSLRLQVSGTPALPYTIEYTAKYGAI